MRARLTVLLVVLLVVSAGATSALAGATQVQDDGTNETDGNATAGPSDGQTDDRRTDETQETEPGPEPEPGPEQGPAENETGEETNATARVTMDDQLSDGQTVVVESFALPEGGFVTIHDERLRDGDATGSVVGVSEYLEPGDYTYVEITLFNETASGTNGTDDATLDEAGNETAVGEDRANDTETTRDGEANDTGPGDGQSDDGVGVQTDENETEPQTGDEPTAGDNQTGNETEVLNDGTRLTENQTLIAMPHRDTNDNREYDFVTSNGTEDGPYVENGTAITDDADVMVVNASDVPMALPFEIERDEGQTVNETVEPFLEPPENETNGTAAGNETGPGDGAGAGPDGDAGTADGEGQGTDAGPGEDDAGPSTGANESDGTTGDTGADGGTDGTTDGGTTGDGGGR